MHAGLGQAAGSRCELELVSSPAPPCLGPPSRALVPMLCRCACCGCATQRGWCSMAPSCWTSIAAGWTQRSVSCKPVGAGVPPVLVGVASWAGVRYIPSRMGPVQRSAVLAARSRGPAVWEVHEQVAIAAMEAGCKELALRLVKNVNKRFPSGTRGSRLTVGWKGGRKAYNAESVCVSTWVGWGEPLHVACHVPGQQRSIAYVCTCMAAAGPGRCCSSPLLGAGRAASWPGRPILAPCAPSAGRACILSCWAASWRLSSCTRKSWTTTPPTPWY